MDLSVGKRLDGKVAIITGASRGIGRATALLFAREGARVCVNFSRNEKSATEVARGIERLGSSAITARADVSDATQVKAMVASTERELGPADILVNNAGILHYGDILKAGEKKFNQLLEVNVNGVVNCTKEVQAGMIKKRYGKVVNITSIAGIGTSAEGTTIYAVSKGAVIILTKRLALQLGRYGINVNAIAPGYIRTDMTLAGKTKKEFDEGARAIKLNTILSRIGTPEDAANAILFLASDESSFITGQVLTIDGGRMDFLSHSL